MWWRWWENPAVKDLRPAAPAPKASLTAVFRVSALSYTRIRTHLDFLGRGFDLDHIPPTKTDPCGSVLLVSHARFELASNVPCKPCNYCISASGVSFLTGEFSDFSDHYFYICVGLYVSRWVYRFPDARSRQTE